LDYFIVRFGYQFILNIDAVPGKNEILKGFNLSFLFFFYIFKRFKQCASVDLVLVLNLVSRFYCGYF